MKNETINDITIVNVFMILKFKIFLKLKANINDYGNNCVNDFDCQDD